MDLDSYVVLPAVMVCTPRSEVRTLDSESALKARSSLTGTTTSKRALRASLEARPHPARRHGRPIP